MIERVEDAGGDAAPQLTFAFEARVDVDVPRELGMTPQGRCRIVPIRGGTFAGPRLAGRILPGFDDQFMRSDGVLAVRAYYGLEIDDGTIVAVVNRGLRHGPPEVIERLVRGERVDPDAYYFRTVPEFSVGAGPHAWLNTALFIGVAQRLPDVVSVRFLSSDVSTVIAKE